MADLDYEGEVTVVTFTDDEGMKRITKKIWSSTMTVNVLPY